MTRTLSPLTAIIALALSISTSANAAECPETPSGGVAANGFSSGSGETIAVTYDGDTSTGSPPLYEGAYFEAYGEGEYEFFSFVVSTTSSVCDITATIAYSDTGSSEGAWTDIMTETFTISDGDEVMFDFRPDTYYIYYGFQVTLLDWDCTGLRVMEVWGGSPDCDEDTYLDTDVTGGDDCQDEDADIYPGASDTWYDGTDSDCAGDDDFDADGDGHQAMGYNAGDDCNDFDASTYPGASETPYDGIDNDCDETTPDDDLDGDGYGYADDCDDDDASTHPGADDTWYDGDDTDCEGNDDYDQDADGYSSTNDCDDTDSSVWDDCDSGSTGDSGDSGDSGATDDTGTPDSTPPDSGTPDSSGDTGSILYQDWKGGGGCAPDGSTGCNTAPGSLGGWLSLLGATFALVLRRRQQ